MGYRIQYGPMGREEAKWHERRFKKGKTVAAWVTLAVVFLLLAVGIRTGTLEEYLIPGDPAVTKAAFIQFTEDVKQGEDVGQAITAFCREIIDHADIH